MMRPMRLLVLTLSLTTAFHSAEAQQRTAAPPSATAVSSDKMSREQDGLLGPVRRVRKEVAKLIVKSGQLVEGPRKLQGTDLYDRRGNKADNEYFMTEEDNLTGKEVYRKFDDKGNVVEMELQAGDGSVISRETYAYEFDAVGNWTKMTTSVAVIEGGRLSYEPIEVTYRTITYYSTDAVARVINPGPQSPGDAGASPVKEPTREGGAPLPTTPQAVAAANETAPAAGKTNPPPSVSRADAALGEPVTPAKATEGARSLDVAAVDKEPAANRDDTAAPTTLVKNVSGEELRRAAVYMPQPIYPTGAALAKVVGKVDVQVIVDEKGEVSSTRVVSGHPLLADAAEQAARHARFSPTRLSNEPARVFGLLSYDFKYDPSAVAPPATSPPVVEASLAAPPGDSKRAAESNAGEPAANTPRAESAAKSPEAADAEKYAQIGSEYYKFGKHKDAIKAFKEAARLDPANYQLHYNLGVAYLELERDADAINAFKKAVGLKPDAADAHYYSGVSNFNLRRYPEALKSYKRAVQLRAGSANYHFGLGMAYLATKDLGAARNQVRILKGLNSKLADTLSETVRAFSVAGFSSTGGFADRMRR